MNNKTLVKDGEKMKTYKTKSIPKKLNSKQFNSSGKTGKSAEKQSQSVSKLKIAKSTRKSEALSATIKGEKLQKVLARAGQGARREIETMIEAGRISVNGKVAT